MFSGLNTSGGKATSQLNTKTNPTIETTGEMAALVLDVVHQSDGETSGSEVSFVNHLLTLSQQPTSRGQADGAPSPPSSQPPTPSTCVGLRPRGPPPWMEVAAAGGGWCCHLPQHGVLMLMDSRRSPG